MIKEKVLFSCHVYKYNHAGKRQKRVLSITNKHIYNMSPKNLITEMFASIMLSSKIKRKIALNKIKSLFVSSKGIEFVIHVPDEYDYRFESSSK